MGVRSSLEIPAYTKTTPTLERSLGIDPTGKQFAFQYHDSRKRQGASGTMTGEKAVALFDEAVATGRYEIKYALKGEKVELARAHQYKPFREFLTIRLITE